MKSSYDDWHKSEKSSALRPRVWLVDASRVDHSFLVPGTSVLFVVLVENETMNVLNGTRIVVSREAVDGVAAAALVALDPVGAVAQLLWRRSLEKNG